MKRIVEILKVFLIFLTLCTIPLAWLRVTIGPLNLKTFHLSILISLFIIIIDKESFKAVFRVINKLKFFILSYSVYVIINFVWCIFPTPGSFTPAVKIFTYFIFFISFLSVLLTIDLNDLVKHYKNSIFLSLAIFILIASIIFSMVGESFFNTIIYGFLKGDINVLKFSIYKKLFNSTLFEGQSGDTEFGNSLRNTVIGAFILYFILARISLIWVKRNIGNQIMIYSCLAISAFFVIVSLSRSNMLGFLMSVSIPYILHFKFTPLIKKKSLIKNYVIFSGILFVIPFGLMTLAPFITIILERIREIAHDPRIQMYLITLKEIESSLLIGYGTSARLLYFRDLQVHNLFLASIYQFGILGLISTLCFYFAILKKVISYAIQAATIKESWPLALAALPIFRPLVSGNSGNYTFIEWLMLTCFFYWYLNFKQNDR